MEYGGENQEGLRKMVAGLTWQKRMEFFIIIDHIPDRNKLPTNTSRKKSLMLYKHGNPYPGLCCVVLPHLRKAICKIEYDVQNFNMGTSKC